MSGTDVVVTVRSSIKALIGRWHTPDFVKGRLDSTSADLTIMFMARANSVTEMIQPEIIIIIQNKVCDFTGNMMSLKGELNKLMRYRGIRIGEVQPEYDEISFAFSGLPDELCHHACMYKQPGTPGIPPFGTEVLRNLSPRDKVLKKRDIFRDFYQ